MDVKDGLKLLEEAIERTEENKRRREKEGEERARLKELEEERSREEENKKLKVKLEMAEEIFRWGKEFSQSDLYKRLRNVSIGSPVCYTSFWGHRRDGRAFGCISNLWLEEGGTFFYRTRYKWMNGGGGIQPTTFEKPEEMAETLTYDYLKELYDCIESGEIYQRIGQELERDRRMF